MAKTVKLHKLSFDELMKAARGEFEVDITDELKKALETDEEAVRLGIMTKAKAAMESPDIAEIKAGLATVTKTVNDLATVVKAMYDAANDDDEDDKEPGKDKKEEKAAATGGNAGTSEGEPANSVTNSVHASVLPLMGGKKGQKALEQILAAISALDGKVNEAAVKATKAAEQAAQAVGTVESVKADIAKAFNAAPPTGALTPDMQAILRNVGNAANQVKSSGSTFAFDSIGD